VSAETHRSGAFEVVIAGGGVAAIETASALSKLAGGLVSLTLLTPNQEFFYRPMTIHEPFGGAPAKRTSSRSSCSGRAPSSCATRSSTASSPTRRSARRSLLTVSARGWTPSRDADVPVLTGAAPV
jgi:hypothetical protein